MMKIPGVSPLPPSAATRVGRAYGLPLKAAVVPTGSPAVRQSDSPPGRPMDAPADLRSVLNDEERAYFEQIAALGPLTYGPGRKAGRTHDAPRGLRLNVQG